MSDDNSNTTSPGGASTGVSTAQTAESNAGIPTSSPAVPSPAQPPEDKRKYIRREITLVGNDTCGGCRDAEHTINTQIKPNSDVETTYKKIYDFSPEGKALAKEKDLKYVPYVRECLISSDPNKEPECKDYKSFPDYKYKLKVNDDNKD